MKPAHHNYTTEWNETVYSESKTICTVKTMYIYVVKPRGHQWSKIVNEISIFNLFQKYLKIYLVFQNHKYIKMSLRFQYLCFKRFSLYFKDLACHSWGQSVSCGSYNNLDNKQKSRVATLTEETKNMQFKTWQSKISEFRISKYLHGFLDRFHKCMRFQGRWWPLEWNSLGVVQYV